jgi:amino acid adenylation domain-containing protein/thioester reductase-like protein
MSEEFRELCVHELFEEQARRSPRATALEDVDGELTYEELDRRAERLASYLRGIGMGPGEVVGVYMERCAEYVIACLAAMKSGGAYLSLELAFPESLLGEVVADAAPRLVLTRERFAGRLPEGTGRLCLDEGWEQSIVGESASGGCSGVTQDDLAFISYSSGTTGKPKGIANSHRAAVRSYLWRFGVSDYGPGDRVGCNVFFIWEMLRPLLRGATTVVIPDEVIYHPAALLSFLEERGITEVLMTPSLLESVLDASTPDLGERLPALRTLWLNGEVVTRTLARRAMGQLPATRLLNVYSCSESHEVAAGDLRELSESPLSTYCPVGSPMDPGRTYILDGDGDPVPGGEAGELFVGGEGLASGYLNLPEKTRESFPADPFSPERGARMYRTGDKARLLSDGAIEILGRTDFMVKIRGYSVELGAVEAAIEGSLAVRACVVIAEGSEGEDKRLVAYLVPATEDEKEGRYAGWSLDEGTGRSPEIRRRLQDRLPHYAIPATFVELETLPLHATSGKVDLEQLPHPPLRPTPAAEPASHPARLAADASRPERVTALARIWERVLRLEKGDVGPDDNFFDIGGHSLAAAQLSGCVEEVFSVNVSMAAFLEDPTVEGLCERIEALQRGGAGAASSPAREGAPDPLAAAVLEPGITPEESNPLAPLSLRGAGSVFLTGATGFLGAFLLDELLSRTGATVYCLVRRRGVDPTAQLWQNLSRYGIRPPEDLARRVVAVSGDLGEPLLGLSESTFDELAAEVDVVIHAGAAVNLVYPYPALEAVNVSGTREVLRLACRRKTKPLAHVSTNGIFPPGGQRWREDVDLDALAGSRDDGYGQTKWVAEKLVRAAAGRGLPVRVYRPGNVSGHSATGASNPRDLLGAVLAESIRLGTAPETESGRFEMTPVDFVAGAICAIADEPETVGGVFHLMNPDPPAASEVFAWLREMDYDLVTLSYAEWLEALRENPPREDDPVGGVLRSAVPEEEMWDRNAYDDRNTRRALRRSGFRRPEIDRELLERYVDSFARRGWLGASPAVYGGRRGPA